MGKYIQVVSIPKDKIRVTFSISDPHFMKRQGKVFV